MSESNLIIAAFQQLTDGQRAALATVVSVEGSSYRRPGARMLITESGETTGVLSGGCLERDVCERAQKVMRTGEPAVVRYDTTSKDDIVWGLGLGCNGIVHVLIEPATSNVAGVMQLLSECAEGDSAGAIATVFHADGDCATPIGARALLYPDGTVDGELTTQLIFDDLRDATHSHVKRYELSDGYIDVFLEVVQPRVRLILFGAGPDVLPIVNLAKAVNWHTAVVDTSARVSSLERFNNADAVVLCRPEDVLAQVAFSERTVVVVMTHNYLHDVELLGQILLLPLPYIGVLGPKRRTERLLNEVSSGNARLAASYLARLHAPVGLDIGAETPEEIALSIISEIKAVVAERPGAQLRDRVGSIHEGPTLVMTPAAA